MPAYTTFGRSGLLTGLMSHVVTILVAMMSISGLGLFFSIVFPFSCLVLAADQHENLVKVSGQKYVKYVSYGNYFKCSIPADWSIYKPSDGLSAEEKKVYGITLFDPRNGSLVPSEISIHYYAPGNLLDKTMDEFVQIHARPVSGFVLEGKSYGEVRQIEITGREAKTFERINIRPIGERAINMPKVSIYEKFIVIPARKDEGFYALKLFVPVEIKSKYTGIFEESVKSFLPGR